MAITYLDSTGSATQGLEFPTATAGTVVTEATVLASGAPRSYKFTSSGAGAGASLRKAGIMANAGRRVSIYYKTGALPVTNNVAILSIQTASGAANVLNLNISPTGALLLSNPTPGVIKTSTTLLVANTVYRLSIAYIITTTTNWTYKLWINGVLEFTATNADATISSSSSADLTFGWLVGVAAGNNVNSWIQHLYVDDDTSLTDTGDVRVTYKAPAAINSNTWNAVVGSGAVNERPISNVNGWSETSTTQRAQNWTLQDAATGDVDITEATIVGYAGWAWAKASSLTGPGTPGVLINNATTAVTLTTSEALYVIYVTSASYPSNAAGIGMRSSGAAADTLLYECGALIAFLHPIARTQSLSGSVASTGVTGKLVSNTVAGSVASAGTTGKAVAAHLAGAVASAGTLAKSKLASLALGGAMASAGAVLKVVSLTRSGAAASVGAVGKQVAAHLAGAVSSAGVLTKTKLAKLALSGAVASAGTVRKLASTSFSGGATSAGTLVRLASRSLAGSVASSGTVGKLVSRSLAGSVASSGTVGKLLSRALAGTLASAGALVKQASTTLSGALASIGDLGTDVISGGGTLYTLAIDGAMATAGALGKLASKITAGAVASSGTVGKQPATYLAGSVNSSGAVSKLASRTLSGTLASAGAVSRVTAVGMAGSVALAGGLVKVAAQALAGLLGSIGDLVSTIVHGIPAEHGSVTLESRVVGLTMLESRLVGAGTLSERELGAAVASSRAVGGTTLSEREAGGGSITLEDR
jgi:hypothetical protein